MENYKEDTNQSFGTIFFLVLFFLLVSASSNIQGNHNSSSTTFAKQNELVFGDISSHHNAIICKAVGLPDLQKYCECAPSSSSLNTFSIQNKISDYNRKSAHNFILIQKTNLSIRPVLPLRLYCHLHSDKDDNLPVLS